jgi:AcrR family transcriptional regulator
VSKHDSPTEQIRQVALKVFSEKGFKGATIADIAARARISPATIYKHFQNKAELFDSLKRPDLQFPTAASQERKRSILDAALHVFGDKGYDRATLDEIAERAGISKATIYLYFPNKKELFAELVHTQPPMVLLGELGQIRGTEITGDVEHDLTLLTYAFLSAFDDPERVSLVQLALSEMGNFPDVGNVFFHEIYEVALPGLMAYFEHMVKDGKMRLVDAEFAAQSFISLLVSLVIQYYVILNETLPFKDKLETATKAVKLFLYGALNESGYHQVKDGNQAFAPGS